MTLPPPIYDLVLLLDPQLEEPARAKIVADARATIEAQGDLVRHDPWGERPLAYPIARKASAEYHLLQFHAGTPKLLDSLEHSLRIIDGILRFRIIKLKPGVPDAPDMRASSSTPRRADAEAGHEQAPDAEPPSASTSTPEPASEPEPSSTPEPEPAAEPAAEVQVGDHA
ncbi:MAG: rpsF [Solirubrobacterales bacterium]|nr:rpsF [Solirubrobacterales bacterium]